MTKIKARGDKKIEKVRFFMIKIKSFLITQLLHNLVIQILLLIISNIFNTSSA
jgi:hypothetical protein